MREITQVELYVDGGSRGNPGPAACAFIIKTAEGKTLAARGIYLGKATNNVAEYSALVRGVQAVRDLGVKELHIFSDSELMVRQIIGEYQVKSPDLKDLHHEAQRLLLGFDRWQIKHIRRELNSDADSLVNETLDDPEGGSGDEDSDLPPEDTFDTPSLETLETKSAEISETPVKVLVEVMAASGKGGCPAGMQKGQCFVFTEFFPAGVCIHAAQALLPTILALRHVPPAKGKPLTVKCSRPGCKTGFKIFIV
jgi:uncharacterized repeat protein (TIGR04076 family)